jgi:hypothetical protein
VRRFFPHLRLLALALQLPMTWKRPPVPRPDPDFLAAAHAGLIHQAPMEITILREVKAHEGTHRAPWVAEPEDGITTEARIALVGGGSTNVSDPLTGHQERDSSWGLLLPPGLPLHAGDGEDGRSRLEFLHPTHGRLRIRRLRPWDLSSRVIGWQADLERIAGSTPVPAQLDKGGRPRLEADPEHPWREIVAKAEAARAKTPSLSWAQIAARLELSEERLAEYRRRSRAA